MTTLVVAGAQAAGNALVKTASSLALSFANSAISRAFDTRTLEGPRLSSFQLMTSRDGAPMARSYGRVRLAGQVIWASRLKETSTTSRQGGKGGPKVREYSYSISFAVGLCEGEIQSVDRIWVNGQTLTTAGLTFRVYNGTDSQLPDPIISAVDGTVPAFRGTAYIVFEDFPLDDYGARLPQINVELTRVPPSSSDEPRLETLVTGVHLLPSSGEFAYSTDIVEDISSPSGASGTAKPINMNNISGNSDIVQAVDQLETALPNCKNVSLVISWFGDDLRVGHCAIRPGVETETRTLDNGAVWQAGGVTRDDAYLISTDDEDRPVYGGTPSDASIVQAIAMLKQRGFKVTIYPFILMDIAQGNNLPDPYGGGAQAEFPWRGRITCTPAPGQAGTVDKTAAASAQIDAFFGTATASDFGQNGTVQNGTAVSYNGPSEHSLRRFILHYAKLAQIAGGVERFVISSELVGITTIRSSRTDYPATAHLRSLAGEVRAILPNAELSYAADWSEYFGHHPDDDDDVNFHLDALWADPNIDAVGIDAYFPLSDWRDGTHLDSDLGKNIYDLDYLRFNIRKGEGFDYYYADENDRDSQTRTTITDGAYNKPWTYRYKDLFNWWYHPHINRADGVETTTSAWVPRGKPFWLTEIGCPAIDRGANQPNVFYDPKSAESALPYHSSGTRDDLIQRRYIEAILSFYTGIHNPTSDVYSGRMIDVDATHVWCWDARPYPDFPARRDIWADGPNWELGHWLTGRTGLVLVADVVRDLVLRSGVETVDVSDIRGVIEGYVIDRPMSTRAALSPLSMIYGFDMVERASGLAFRSQSGGAEINLTLHDISLADDSAAISRKKDDPEGRLLDVRLHYIDGARDHQSASIFARELHAQTVQVLDVQVPIVMDTGFARVSAERLLSRSTTLDQSVEFMLSPARLDIEVGDRLSLPGQSGVWQISRLEKSGSSGGPSRVSALAAADVAEDNPRVALTTPTVFPPIIWAPKPHVVVLDIPQIDSTSRSGPLVGVALSPFANAVISAGGNSIVTTNPVLLGEIITGFNVGAINAKTVGRYDYAAEFEFSLGGIELASVSAQELLSGENRFAVEIESAWEIIQIASLTLVGENRYAASVLLRGLFGTDVDMGEITAGARIVWLGQGFVNLPVSADIGDSLSISAVAAGRESDPVSMVYQARHLRPLSPVHARAVAVGSGLEVSWIRRSRIAGDSWSGLDIPLGEDIALFRVQAIKNGVVVETVETAQSPALILTPDPDELRIAQGSTAYGYGGEVVVGGYL